MWKSENIPDGWRESLLLQKQKKPNITSLNNIRFLHLKKEVSQIVFSSIKDRLFANMSKFQIATKPGHRSTEHLFVILSLIALCESTNSATLITMYDQESVFDCLSELYRSQVRGKLYRLVYNLNKSSKIRIQTSWYKSVGRDRPYPHAGVNRSGCMQRS